MRTTLFGLLVLVLLTAAWTGGGALAEDEALAYRAFDVSTLVRARPERVGGVLGMLAPWETEPEPAKVPEAASFIEGDALVELIRAFVDPESWDEIEGAFIETSQGTLRVRHHPAIIERVKATLDELVKQAKPRARLSVEVDEGEAAVVDSVSLDLPLGVRRSASATRRMQYVVDYDMEVAQASNIANPIVMVPEDGLIVDARATPLLDGRRVMVEAFVQRGRYDEVVRRLTLGIDEECFSKPFRSTFRSYLGTLDLPSFDAAMVHWTAVVASGETIEVPLAWNGTPHLIRLKAEMEGGLAAGGPLIDLSSLDLRPFACRVENQDDDDEQPSAPRLRCTRAVARSLPSGMLEDGFDLITRIIRPEIWNDLEGTRLLGSRLFVPPEASGLRAPLRAFLEAQEALAIRPVVLDLRVVSVGASSPEARVIAAGRVPTILGRMASILVGNTSNFLVGYDVSVAQEARVSDPTIGQSFDGLAVNLLPRMTLDGENVNVEVDLILSFRTLDPDPPSLDAQFLGPLDRVQTRRSKVDTDVVVPKDGTAVIDLGRDPKDPSRRLELRLRASMP